MPKTAQDKARDVLVVLSPLSEVEQAALSVLCPIAGRDEVDVYYALHPDKNAYGAFTCKLWSKTPKAEIQEAFRRLKVRGLAIKGRRKWYPPDRRTTSGEPISL